MPLNDILNSMDNSLMQDKPLHQAWWKKFELLKAYKTDHGHINVPLREDSAVLGSWIYNQRSYYKLKRDGRESPLTDDQEGALNKMGIVWDCREAAWLEKLDLLRSFRAKNGHTNVTVRDHCHQILGQWIKTQRKQYKLKHDKKPSTLTDEREAALNKIGFVWDSRKAAWTKKLELLKQYKAEHGDTNVPQNHKQLGAWINTLRKQYKDKQQGKPTQMTDEREAALNEIGFNAGSSNKAVWAEKFELLKQYKACNGNVDVPRHHAVLGKWVSRQRYDYKLKLEGKQTALSDERVNDLNLIGFIWNYQEATWTKKFELLKKYKAVQCTALQTSPPNIILRSWVAFQRRQYRQKRNGEQTSLTDEREAALNGIGFIWESREACLY